ncbi:MAG: hypothetical protein ACC707_13635, partial [Thiohalomonadales bacterium]
MLLNNQISVRLLTFKRSPVALISVGLVFFIVVISSLLVQRTSVSYNASEGLRSLAVMDEDRHSLGTSNVLSQETSLAAKNNFALQYQQQTPITNGGPAWRAINTSANIEAYFFADGPVILPASLRNAWKFKIHLMQVKIADEQYVSTGIPPHIPENAVISATNNKIEYQRGILTEWYINDARGLEHGLTIDAHEWFDDKETLTVLVEIDGSNQTLAQVVDSRNLRFDSKLNKTSLLYSHLEVVDKNGEPLRAEFNLKGNQIEIVMDIKSAQFPITIDPLITSSNWETKGSGLFGESYGHAVASVG